MKQQRSFNMFHALVEEAMTMTATQWRHAIMLGALGATAVILLFMF